MEWTYVDGTPIHEQLLNHKQMHTIKVKRDKVLKKLKENKAKHQREYAEALKAYKEKALDELDRLILKATQGETKLELRLVEPVDYTERYDDAILKIEWNENKTIEMSHELFEEYILDKFHWRKEAAFTNAMYLSASH